MTSYACCSPAHKDGAAYLARNVRHIPARCLLNSGILSATNEFSGTAGREHGLTSQHGIRSMSGSTTRMAHGSELLSIEFRERLRRLRIGAERLHPQRAGQGSRMTRARGQGIEFVGHRAYSPGDDIRMLDWNANARLDQLVVKQFATPGEVTLVLAVDCSPTMDFGTPGKFWHARMLAAALGSIALFSRERVMLAPMGPKGGRFAIFDGARHEQDLLAALHELSPSRALRKSGHWLSRLVSLSGDAFVVVLSDFIHQPPIFELVRELKHRRAQVLAMHILAPDELHPPADGRTELQLVEPFGRARMRIELDAEMLRRYREELERYRHAVAASCLRLGAGHFETCSVERMESLILDLVAMGAIRASGQGKS